MFRTRGEANQALYRAKILLNAWDSARSDQAQTDALLTAAFLPAVKLHLAQAYGWFLLSVAGIEQAASAIPPRGSAEIPAPEAGKSPAPELLEFSQLETSGWIADMLKADVEDSQQKGVMDSGGLLGSDRQVPGFAVAQSWHRSLATTMARMDDLLAEC